MDPGYQNASFDAWAGVDSVWEQRKPEARKMLLNRAESHLSVRALLGGLEYIFNYIL